LCFQDVALCLTIFQINKPTKFSLFDFALCIIQTAQSSCCAFLFFSDFESRRRRSLDPDKIIFRPDCIYCEKEGRKKIKVKGSWKTERTVRFEYDGGVTVQRIAQEKHDEHLLTRIRGVDLQ
jgi:hypothetical protein